MYITIIYITLREAPRSSHFGKDPPRLAALYQTLSERGQARAFRQMMQPLRPISQEVLEQWTDLDVTPEFFLLVLEYLTTAEPQTASHLIATLAAAHPEILTAIAFFPAPRARQELGVRPEALEVIQKAA